MSVYEVVYTADRDLDATSARDVLAFVLVQPRQYSADPVERMAIAQVIEPAKRAAITRWLQNGGRR